MKQAKNWNLEPTEARTRIQCSWRGNWLVLRCANKNTIPLVAALTALGIEAWTPLWLRQRRYPRSSQAREMLLPCLPSFAFLSENDAHPAIKALDMHGVPSFSFMNSYGVMVRIKDQDLESLRQIADLNPRKENPVHWPDVGSEQRIISGAFQGLLGTVKAHTHRHCLVDVHDTSFPLVKIPPFLLADIEA